MLTKLNIAALVELERDLESQVFPGRKISLCKITAFIEPIFLQLLMK